MTDWASKVQGALSHLNKVVSIIASLPFIIIMLITVYEVIVRYVFNAPTVWTLEISQYLMLIGAFLAAAYTLEVGGHIKVDFLVERLSPGKRRIVNIISSLLGIIFFAALVWKSTELAWFTFKFGLRSMTMLAVPLFPIYVIMPIGSFLLLLQGIVQFLQLIVKR